ncbi:MAG: hypothetical protein ACPGOV_00550 [Magnetovibrionaceae bacterium]
MTETLTSETPVFLALNLPRGGSIRANPVIEVRVRLERPLASDGQEGPSESAEQGAVPGLIQVLLAPGGSKGGNLKEGDSREVDTVPMGQSVLGLISPYPPFKPGEERTTLFVLPDGETLRPDSRLHLRLIPVHPAGEVPTDRFVILGAEARRD